MILNQVPELFDGIEFGTVWWKHDDVHTGGHLFMVSISGMEARAVPYDDMLMIWILALDLFQEGFGPM